MVSLVSLVLACTAPASDPTDSGGSGAGVSDDGALDSGGTGGTDAPLELEPAWTAEEAVAALQAAIDAGLPQPSVARDAFLGLIAEGQDSTCPGTTDFDGSQPLGCLSESGYLYAGISEYRVDDFGWALGGDFEIREPDGPIFYGAGFLAVGGNSHGRYLEFSGFWAHEGGADWLDAGRSGMFSAFTGGGWTTMSGGLDLDGASLHFSEVQVQHDGEQTVTGTVGIRDASGAWWWLELGLDGCGPLSFGTEEVGTGCVELAGPIATWAEGFPG